MSARRLLAVLAAAAWLAPSALAAGVTLHVALDHPRTAVAHGLADLVEHGHAHAGDAGEHGHEVAMPSETTVGRLVASASVPVCVEAAAVENAAAPARLAGPPPAPPPRLAGQPLLALLSTLRL